MSNQLDEALADFERYLEPEDSAPEKTAEEQPEPTPEPGDKAPETPVEQPSVEQEGQKEDQGESVTPEQLLAGKFKTQEDLEQAYKNLEQKLGDPERLDLQIRQLEERLSRYEQADEDAGIEINQETVSWFDDAVGKSPQQAAVWALENDKTGVLYERAMEAWYDDSPRQAARFEQDLAIRNLAQEWEKRLGQQTAPYEEMASKTAISQAWAQATPEMTRLGVQPAQIVEAAKTVPQLAEGLKTGTAEERAGTIRNLAYLAAGMATQNQSASGPSPADTEESPAKIIQQAARDAKLSGSVATQTTTQEPEAIDEGEAWLERTGFNAILDARDPYRTE